MPILTGSLSCLSCPETGTPFLDGGQCLSTCPSGKYADSDGFCQTCSSTCAGCDSGSSCTSCSPDASLFSPPDLSGDICVSVCSSGQFLPTPTADCAGCSSNCSSCSATAANCTSCDLADPDHYFLYGGECLLSCPASTYPDSGIVPQCWPCHETCATCNGGDWSDCTTCASSYPYSLGSTCVASCSGFADADSACQPCDLTCNACSGPTASNCTTCPSYLPHLHVLHGTGASAAGVCYASCPKFTYSNSGVCEACDESCLSCLGPSACTSCPTQLPHLDLGTNLCTCSTGYTSTTTACTQINECAEGTHNCWNVSACTDTAGSFSCACPLGYSGNGTYCEDVDECAAGTHECHALAVCTNSPGSYACMCSTLGYEGNGLYCAGHAPPSPHVPSPPPPAQPRPRYHAQMWMSAATKL